jgi:hypothetical protein
MSCHHRHGPWCCDDSYAPSYYPTRTYATAPPPYPPAAYTPTTTYPGPGRGSGQEALRDYLEHLERELARIRDMLPATEASTEKTG